MSPSENKPKKKLSKKAKIILLMVGWLVLLGAVAGIALLTKSVATEVDNIDKIAQVYKFANNSQRATDIVDDLDYYGYYSTNPITLTQITEGEAKGAYTISGLKDKAVEEKINNRLKAVMGYYQELPNVNNVYMHMTANYFNILSLSIGYCDLQDTGCQWIYNGVTFDLNTGEELSFDNLFSKDVNLISLLYKLFYDRLSTDIKFDRLYAERRLEMERYCPDPSSCSAQYAPLPGETYDSIRALISDYDAQIANIEQITFDTIQDYLAGEKKFYLNSYGPTFILSDNTQLYMKLKDDIRYAVYLKNYRTSEEIYEDNSLAITNLYFTDSPNNSADYYKEQTDGYLFDYDGSCGKGSEIAPLACQALRDYIKEKALATKGEEGKFRYILAYGTIHEHGNIREGNAKVRIFEVDKSYYESTFRKTIIDQIREGYLDYQNDFDDSNVVQLMIDGASGLRGLIITNANQILDDVSDVLDSSIVDMSWQDYLKDNTRYYLCHRAWEPKCYTDAELQTHEFIYSLTDGPSIAVRIKGDSDSGDAPLHTFYIPSIPSTYIKPEVWIKK